MSDALRTLEGAGLRLHTRGGQRRMGCFGKYLVPVVFLAGTVGFLWFSRDGCPMERLIPQDQSYRVFANDILSERGKIAGSPIWQSIPPSLGLGDISGTINQEIDVPEWMLHHLVPGACHVSGDDVDSFGDILFVTRMTRIGALLMRFDRFVPGVERDYAGGLRLSHIPGVGIYFAARGRVLAVSPSRDALIRAITLREEDAMPEGAVAHALGEGGGEDLRGTIALDGGDPGGDVLQTLSFALRMDGGETVVKCRAAFRPEWQERLRCLLEGVSPQNLPAPPEGMLQIAVNLGKPIEDLWPIVGRVLGKSEQMDALWAEWTAPSADGIPAGWPQIAAAVFGPLGPGLRVTWCGVDFDEMIPAPEVVFVGDGSRDAILASFERLPPVPADAQPYDLYARYDADARRVTLPLIGGPSLEPTAYLYDNALLFSTSRSVADRLVANPAGSAYLDRPGNLYFRIDPGACADAIFKLIHLLAEYDLLRGYTVESVESTAAPWLAAARSFKEVLLLAACENGEVSGDFRIVCAMPPEK